MNCPSRVDESIFHDGWNQNPPALAADTTTRRDLNGIVNSRRHRDAGDDDGDEERNIGEANDVSAKNSDSGTRNASSGKPGRLNLDDDNASHRSIPRSAGGNLQARELTAPDAAEPRSDGRRRRRRSRRHLKGYITRVGHVLSKYAKFIGPGFMVSVAYIDPGNYSTDVAAGSAFRFRLLFVVLMSNLFAIFLQSLCIKLGTVTGLNLAEHCRAHLPRWLNFTLYLFAEAAIVATDIAEVIGSAIALNLLLHIPLVAGCALTLLDVLVILLLYNPSGSMKRLRAFESFVVMLVLGVVVAFCVQLSYIEGTGVGEVVRGYLPSATVVKSKGLYLSCGILGATVMPHGLYLGSGMVQARLKKFDPGASGTVGDGPDGPDAVKYRPSLTAIRYCLKYSVIELAASLFTFALFVNSSILIVAGAALSNNADAQDADLFEVHDLLSRTLAPVAGTVFALALLLSGTSAGIVCTIAGQMVSEGALRWTIAPWIRRLVTRAISITPSIIIAAAVGRKGLSTTLTATQVVLSVLLPIISAPLIYFTARSRYMSVPSNDGVSVSMKNHWFTTGLALAIWCLITVMNVALLVLLGLGKA